MAVANTAEQAPALAASLRRPLDAPALTSTSTGVPKDTATNVTTTAPAPRSRTLCFTRAVSVTDLTIETTVDAEFLATLPVDVQPAVTQLTSLGAEWAYKNAAGQVVVNYSFMNSVPTDYRNSGEAVGFSVFTEEQKAATRAALATWSDVANIVFVEVADNGSIRFGNTTSGPDVGWTYAPGAGKGGDVWINPGYYTNVHPKPGGYGFKTLVHEIGHAIGLDHAGDYNWDGTTLPGPTGPYDTRKYSIMSYYDDVTFAGIYGAGPALHDIAAIEAMYGANMSTRADDTVYTWSATTTFAPQAVWDAGGVDTFDLSNQTVCTTVNLNDGSFSSIGLTRSGTQAVDNVAIAYGASIENAIGGSGNDTLIGNGLANVLEGGAGNDSLAGGDGGDTYVFKAGWGFDIIDDGVGMSTLDFGTLDLSGAAFILEGDTLAISYGGSTVTVTNYVGHEAQYTATDAAGSFALVSRINDAPIVAANGLDGLDLVYGSVIAVKDLFTVTDAEGDIITQYRLRDTAGGNGMLFDTNRKTALTEGVWTTVSAADFANLFFKLPTTGAIDTIQVQAFDGKQWSTVTSQSVAPVAPPVSANDDSLAGAQYLGKLNGAFTLTHADSLSPTDTTDCYRFTVLTDGQIGLNVSNLVPTDAAADLYLYDGAGNFLQNSVLGGVSSQFITATLEAGDYYLAVRPGSGAESGLSYTIGIDQNDNSAPIVTAKSQDGLNRAAGGRIYLKDLFSVSDADSDAITQYRILDMSADSGSGSLANNGTAYAAGSWVTISAADWNSAYFQSPAAPGTETISVLAFDGKNWSTLPASQTIETVPNMAPVVTAKYSNYFMGAGPVLLHDLFNITDPDGSAITEYRFRSTNSTAGIVRANFGYEVVISFNGPWDETGWRTVKASSIGTPGEFDRFVFEAKAVDSTNTIEMQVFDGKDWSTVASQTITVLADNTLTGAKTLGTLGAAGLNATGSLDGDHDDRDCYSFTLSGTQVVDISLTGLSANADLRLFSLGSGDYKSVVADSVNPGSSDEHMTLTLAAGTYAVRVGGEATTYALSVTQSAAAPGNNAPVTLTAASPFDLWGGQQIKLSHLFAGRDEDEMLGNPRWVRVRDLTAGGAELDFSAVLPEYLRTTADGWTELPYWGLDLVNVINGSDGTADQFEMMTSDGTAWSAPTTLTVRNHGTLFSQAVAGAQNLGTLTTHRETWVADRVAPEDGMKYYKFNMSRNSKLSWFDVAKDMPAAFYVFDASGKCILDFDSTQVGSGGSQASYQLAAGDYYLGVQAWDMGTFFMVRMRDNSDPVITVKNTNALAANTWYSLASLIGIVDPDNDLSVSFTLKDELGKGYFIKDGVRLTDAQTNTIYGFDNLSKIYYVTGDSNATETILVTAGDSYNGWASQTMTFETSTSVAPPPNTAPVVTAQPLGGRDLTKNTKLFLKDLFSASDADGDNVVQYRIKDVSAAADTGFLARDYFFTANNVQYYSRTTTYASGSWITISAQDWGSIYYQSPGAAGTDTIVVEAFDGKEWSAVTASQTIVTTAPATSNSPPVVTVKSLSGVTTTIGSKVALTSLFSTTDPDGNSVTQYRVRVTSIGENYGAIVASNTLQAQGAWQLVSANDFRSLTYQQPEYLTANTIEVQAFDGTDWGAAASLTLNATVAAGAPVITAIGASSFASGGEVALSQLFSVTDDGTVSQFRIYSTNSGGHNFMLSSQGWGYPAGYWKEMTAQEFADATYSLVYGGTVTIWAQAFDGTNWGARTSKTFTVAAGAYGDAPESAAWADQTGLGFDASALLPVEPSPPQHSGLLAAA